MFNFEIQRHIISDSLMKNDRNSVNSYIQEHNLGEDSMEANMLMQDLDQTRIQRSVAILNLLHIVPSMENRLSFLEVSYDLKSNHYTISDSSSIEPIMVGSLY